MANHVCGMQLWLCSDKPESVCRPVVRFSHGEEISSVSCVTRHCEVLPPRATLAILGDVVNPARLLVLYLLEYFRRINVPLASGNVSLVVECAAPFYTKCPKQFQDGLLMG